jgi:excisionase family DNA binding protein
MKEIPVPHEIAGSLLIADAAEALGVSRRTVYYHIQSGRLQTIRTRGGSQRVLWSSIESFLRENCGRASMRPPRREREA